MVWGDQWEDGGEGKDIEEWRGHYIYVCEDSIMKPSKHCMKKGGGKKGE
jgi:hypothetical protein